MDNKVDYKYLTYCEMCGKTGNTSGKSREILPALITLHAGQTYCPKCVIKRTLKVFSAIWELSLLEEGEREVIEINQEKALELFSEQFEEA